VANEIGAAQTNGSIRSVDLPQFLAGGLAYQLTAD